MVLGKLPVPERSTNLDNSRARAYCTCSRCRRQLFGHFSIVYHFLFLSPSLWETARYRLKCCLKGPLNPIQPTNQRYLMCLKIQFLVQAMKPNGNSKQQQQKADNYESKEN